MTDSVGIRITELYRAIAEDPKGPEFVELAGILAEEAGTRAEAREICFRGINQNPDALRGRLLLARLFYLDGLREFAARELAELSKFANVPGLVKLMEAFGPYMKSYEPVAPDSEGGGRAGDEDLDSEVLAEIDLDAEFGDVLDELPEKP